MKPATGDCDTTEYFMKSSNGLLPQSAIVYSETNPATRSYIAANLSILRARLRRVHDRRRYDATRGADCQQLIVLNHLERGIEAHRSLLGGVTRAILLHFVSARCINLTSLAQVPAFSAHPNLKLYWR